MRTRFTVIRSLFGGKFELINRKQPDAEKDPEMLIWSLASINIPLPQVIHIVVVYKHIKKWTALSALPPRGCILKSKLSERDRLILGNIMDEITIYMNFFKIFINKYYN